MHRILIIDDSWFARFKVRQALLGFAGVDTLEAENGPLALEAMRWYQPDLILLDIVMPLENGLAVLKQIIHLNIKSRIIMVSAVDTPAILADCIALGIDDFVVKPFEVQSLQQAIQNVMKWEIGSNEQSQVTDRR
ncbi:MAG: response regulator [Leptospiraceae bacterium]|nr:response regulator [Leptospiraceae bacterium]